MVDSRATFQRLCAAALFAYCGYAICRTPLLPVLAQRLGADAPMIGFVVGASTLTGIAVKALAGAWSDVLGRRPLLIMGALMFALMPFTYLGIGSLTILVPLRFLHGSATAIFGPVASATLSDVAPPHRRATWLSTYSSIQGAGQALGPVLAGWWLSIGRYDLAFITAGVLGLIALAIVVATPPSGGPPPTSASGWRLFAQGIDAVVRDPLILLTGSAQAAQFVLNGTLNAFAPLFARDLFGFSLAVLGVLFGLQTLTTLAARPITGAVSDRIGRRPLIVLGLTTCGGAVLLLSVAANGVVLVAAILIYAVGVAATTSATSAYITDLARGRRYGAAHGVFGTIYDIGDALGPIAAGLLVARVGYPRMFQLVGTFAVFAAVVFSITSSRLIASRAEEAV
jgi:MFS family permease